MSKPSPTRGVPRTEGGKSTRTPIQKRTRKAARTSIRMPTRWSARIAARNAMNRAPPTLLTLPFEVRTAIFTYVLTGIEIVYRPKLSTWSLPGDDGFTYENRKTNAKSLKSTTTILLVSKQCYADAHPLVPKLATVDITGDFLAHQGSLDKLYYYQVMTLGNWARTSVIFKGQIMAQLRSAIVSIYDIRHQNMLEVVQFFDRMPLLERVEAQFNGLWNIESIVHERLVLRFVKLFFDKETRKPTSKLIECIQEELPARLEYDMADRSELMRFLMFGYEGRKFGFETIFSFTCQVELGDEQKDHRRIPDDEDYHAKEIVVKWKGPINLATKTVTLLDDEQQKMTDIKFWRTSSPERKVLRPGEHYP